MTLGEFYAANPVRARSRESDYGVMWRDGGQRGWPQYRVSYIRDTGEVYAVRLDGRMDVEVLAVVPADAEPDGFRGPPWYRTLDSLLDGWAEHCDLAWIRARLASYR